ncbi:MAG: DUF4831 family protein [Bacteroidales bacterium]|nr:DUF4831 family protein [Bacteroidales bacterium]
MRRSLIRITLSLFIVFIFIINGLAQIIVSPANVPKASEAPGFYYALPRNYVKIDFILEKNQRYKGPYADFASKILGIDHVVNQDETIYSILDVIITKQTEPDPTAWFFVEFDEKASKDSKSLIFNLLPDGIILSADDTDKNTPTESLSIEKILVNAPNEKKFHYYAERNLYQRVDTLIRTITIDTTKINRNVLQSSWVDRNPEQKAKAAADMIHKLRDNRFNLISGYQEINYGPSIVFMNDELLKLENEYLSLFIGKEVRTIEEQSFTFLPETGKTGNLPFAKLNDNLGIVDINGKGEMIQIKVEPSGSTQIVSSANKSTGQGRITNSLYYRISENTEISIIIKNKVMAMERMLVSQLGPIGIAPINKTRLVYDAESGSLKTIKRE